MKNVKYSIVLVLIICTSTINAQVNYQRICDTIPYRLMSDKIIIPVTVQDTVVDFILDTGGQTGVTHNFGVRCKAMIKGQRPVGDFSGKSLSYIESELFDVKLSKSYGLKTLKTLIFPSNGFFRHLGVVGILGSDAFSQCVLTIDSKNKIIIINYPYRPHRLKIDQGYVMNQSQMSHPILKTKFGTETIDVLFDTGAHGFLMLSEKDYIRIKEKEEIATLDTFFGIDGVGIGGLGSPREIKKVMVPDINYAGVIFKNTESILTQNNTTIIGLDFIYHGRVVIDYMRGVFYFMPYKNGIVEDIKINKHWDVSVLPGDNNRFIVSQVWSSMKDKVTYGEEVVNINGKELKGMEKNQLIIDKLMDNIKEDSAYLIVVDKNKKERKIIINRN